MKKLVLLLTCTLIAPLAQADESWATVKGDHLKKIPTLQEQRVTIAIDAQFAKALKIDATSITLHLDDYANVYECAEALSIYCVTKRIFGDQQSELCIRAMSDYFPKWKPESVEWRWTMGCLIANIGHYLKEAGITEPRATPSAAGAQNGQIQD